MKDDDEFVMEMAETMLRSIGFAGQIRDLSRMNYESEQEATIVARADGFIHFLTIEGSPLDIIGEMLNAQQKCRNQWRAYRYVAFDKGLTHSGTVLAFADVVDAVFMKMLT